MPMLIHFFGASVTAQGYHHSTGQASGYYPYIKEYYAKMHPEYQIVRTSAGSSHFNDAGFCLLDEVLQTAPNIVVFDWHSTSLQSFDPILFDEAVSKVVASGAQLLLVIFPRKSSVGSHMQRECIKQAYQATGNFVHILDLYEESAVVDAIDDILRDECHTTQIGAKVYSDIVIAKLEDLLTAQPKASLVRRGHESLIPVSKLTIANDYAQFSRITFTIGRRSCSRGATLVLDHKVGPYSPVVEVRTSKGYLKSHSFWDSYCYYERQSFLALPGRHGLNDPDPLSLWLSISDETPKYEQSRNQEYDFSLISSRYMRIKSVYCIGGELLSTNQS